MAKGKMKKKLRKQKAEERRRKKRRERSETSSSSDEEVVENVEEMFVKACVHVDRVSVNRVKQSMKKDLFQCEMCTTKKFKKQARKIKIRKDQEEVFLCLSTGFIGCKEHIDKHVEGSVSHKKDDVKVLRYPIYCSTSTLKCFCNECKDEIGYVKEKPPETQDTDMEQQLQKLLEIIKSGIEQQNPGQLGRMKTRQKLSYEDVNKIEKNTNQEDFMGDDFIYVSKKKLKGKKGKRPLAMSQIIESAAKIGVPVNGAFSGMRGLTNLGNTCFFNSVMQSLTQTQSLASYYLEVNKLLSNSDETNNKKVYAGPLTCALWAFYTHMFSEDKGAKRGEAYSPSILFQHICYTAPRFNGYHQQDAHELLTYLLMNARDEYIEHEKKEMKIREKTQGNSTDSNKRSDNIIDATFKTILSSTIVCHNCKNVSRIFDETLNLSIPIPKVDQRKAKKIKKSTKGKKQKSVQDEENGPVTLGEAFKQLLKFEKSVYDMCPEYILDPDYIDREVQEAKANSSGIHLLECLWLFSKSDRLYGENGYLCEKCSKVVKEVTEPSVDLPIKLTLTADDSEDRIKVTLEPSESVSEETSPIGTSAPKVKTPESDSSTKTDEFFEISDDKPKTKTSKSVRIEHIRRPASKQFAIYEPPKTLVLHIKRFTKNERGTGFKKDSSRVIFPIQLDINCFVAQSSPAKNKNNLYELFAVVEHSGSMGGGHYVAYTKQLEITKDGSSRNHWYYISDSRARTASESEVLSAEAYILFYEQIKP